MEASFPSIPLQPSTTIYNQHPIILSSDLLDLLGGKKPAAQNPSWLNRQVTGDRMLLGMAQLEINGTWP
jgi:hypothetical protein